MKQKILIFLLVSCLGWAGEHPFDDEGVRKEA